MRDGGTISIEKIKEDNSVANLQGWGFVERVFHNRVSLDRVTRINFSDGTFQITTRDHLFLTDSGWMKAVDLCGVYLYRTGSYYVNGIRSRRVVKNGKTTRLWVLWQNLYTTWKEQTKLLFKKLWGKTATSEAREWRNGRERLQVVWKDIHREEIKYEDFLQPILSRQVEESTAEFSREVVYERGWKQDQQIVKGLCGYSDRQSYSEKTLEEDEEKESFMGSICDRERESNKEASRDFAYLEGGTRGEWKVHTGTKNVGVGIGVADGSCNPASTGTGSRVSDLLQGRCGQSRIEDCRRSRWERPSVEMGYLQRCKENNDVERVRVESVEVYERGSDGKSFESVIGDSERDLGYVTFYDLQVSGNHSYFASGFAVHNCHSVTSDAQQALLKMLEDTPEHVWFVLATTDPRKLIPTIKNRCTTLTLKPLRDDEMTKLILGVCGKEGIGPTEGVVEKIVETAAGSPRKALVLLGQVAGIEGEEDQLAAIAAGEAQHEAIEVARLMMNPKARWSDVAKVLKGIGDLEGQAEGIRRLVLAYMSSVALGGGKGAGRAVEVIGIFRDNFYDCGKAGLIASCWESVGH
jgi:hypothetical protein